MNGQAATHSTSSTRLRGRWLLLAQALWMFMALLSVAVFVAGLRTYSDQLHTLCVSDCSDQLTPERLQVLKVAGITLEHYAIYRIAYQIIAELVWGGIGLILFWRKSDDRMALFVALMLVLQPAGDLGYYLGAAQSLWRVPALFVNSLAFSGLVLLFYLFPDGRCVPRWSRLIVMVFPVWSVCATLFQDSPINPDTWPASLRLLFFFILFCTMIGAQLYRYRRISDTRQRQQTKWVVFSLAILIVAALLLGLLPPLLFPGFESSILSPIVSLFLDVVRFLIPLSIGFAILRYRLYDIDIIIRRTLIYSALTLTLGLIYVGCILLSRTLVAPLTGGSELAIVASTLAIAALFNPLRRRIQALIDKRFYRRKYDAAKVLAAFGATVRDETDLEQLTAELVRVVDETMQPEFVGLWLRKVDREGQR